MFNWREKKNIVKSAEVTKTEAVSVPVSTVPPVHLHIEDAIMHCCCTLTPETFEALVKNTYLPFIVWYKAVWYIQHQPDISRINTAKLASAIGVSWPTAKRVKKKILELLLQHHKGE